MQKKNEGNIFFLSDNIVWIGCVQLSPLRREYLSSAVNVLTNSLKISHMTKRDFFKLNYLRSDQYIWQNGRRSDLNSV